MTTRDLKTRVGEHLRKDVTYFGKALAKYGIENFEIEVLDSADTVEELNNLEIEYIAQLNTMAPSGYNLCIGGDTTTGFTHSEESRLKMSETKKAKGSMVGEKNHFYGKTHTEETRAKMSEAWKTRVVTEETKEKMSKASAKAKPVRCLNDGLEFPSAQKAGEYYGISATHIGRVCRGVNKTTHGKVFEFVD